MKQNRIIIGAVAALMAVAPLTARAQTAPTPPPMSADTPDFKLLADPAFDYPAIKGAMAKGFSENEVASVLYIAKQTGMPFREVIDVALEGKTFAAIAYDHNLKLSDVLDPEKEKQELASFLSAYESTGMMAFKTMSAKE